MSEVDWKEQTSAQYGIDRAEVEKYYDEALGKLLTDKSIPEANRVKVASWRARIAIEAKYGGKDKSPSVVKEKRREAAELEGFLIGIGEYRDKRGEATKFIDKFVKEHGKVEAAKQGYIKTDGVSIIYLDYRDETFGKPNPNKGKELAEVKIDAEMSVYAVLRRMRTEDPFVFAKMSTNNSAIANSWFKSLKFPDHLFLPMVTNGNIKETDMGFEVNASAAKDHVSKFTPVSKPSYDVHEAFMQAATPLITPWHWDEEYEDPEAPIDKANPIVQKYLDLLQKPKDSTKAAKVPFDTIFFVRGVVDNIRPEYKNWKGIPAQLIDPDDFSKTIKLNLPEGFETLFGETSEVIAYGKPSEIMLPNATTKKYTTPSGRLEMRCIGAYPIPGFKTTPDASSYGIKEFNAWGPSK